MKKLSITLLSTLILLCACHIDPTVSNAPSTDIESQEMTDWKKTADEISESIIKQHFEIFKQNTEEAAQSGRIPFFAGIIDTDRPDLCELYPFPVYTIDTTLWTTQPNLPFDAYLRLKTDLIGYYMLYDRQLVSKFTAKYDKTLDWRVGSRATGLVRDTYYLSEKTLVSQAMAAGDPIIGLTFPKHIGCFVYIKRNGNWQRVSGGLMDDTGDVVKDLHNSYQNRWIMQ